MQKERISEKILTLYLADTFNVASKNLWYQKTFCFFIEYLKINSLFLYLILSYISIMFRLHFNSYTCQKIYLRV